MAVTFPAWDEVAACIDDRAPDRFEASDIPTARLYWATLALTGDTTAENNLGVLAQRGYDMSPGPDLAREHYTTAADNLDGLGEAVEALLGALNLGEPRGASALAGIAWQTPSQHHADLPAAFIARDSFGWWKVAADVGLPSAKCAIAVNRLREIPRQETLFLAAQASGPLDAETEEALAYAEDCATATRETCRVENRPSADPRFMPGDPRAAIPRWPTAPPIRPRSLVSSMPRAACARVTPIWPGTGSSVP